MLIFVEKMLYVWKHGSLRELKLGVRVWKPELVSLGDPSGKELAVRR